MVRVAGNEVKFNIIFQIKYLAISTVIACTHGTDVIRTSVYNLVLVNLFVLIRGDFTIRNSVKQSFKFVILRFN